MTMNRSDFRFLDRLRVRWAEVDMQKIVFNGHYLMYFDTAVGSYWRALAMPYAETMEYLGGDLFVRKSTLEYLGSARYDELLTVCCRVAKLGRSSMTFLFEIYRDTEVLISAELVYVNADSSMKAAPLPEDLRGRVRKYERVAPQA